MSQKQSDLNLVQTFESDANGSVLNEFEGGMKSFDMMAINSFNQRYQTQDKSKETLFEPIDEQISEIDKGQI